MANPNPIFDTPTKIKHGMSLLSIMDEKKKSSKLSKPPLVKSSPSTGSIVSIWLLTDFFVVVVAIIFAIVAVCCIADVFVKVDEVDAKEKTPFKRWRQTQEEDTTRTQTGCVRHPLVWLDINKEQMFEAHINQQRPI